MNIDLDLNKYLDFNTANASPFVILTYAQTLDGCIGTLNGQQLKISNNLSMSLTHHIRKFSDCIVVGVNTLINDNPSLTCRLPNSTMEDQPTPIIIDPNFKTPVTCKIINNFKLGVSKKPFIISYENSYDDPEHLNRRSKLINEGVEILPILEKKSENDFEEDFFKKLSTSLPFEVRSIMVEGGSTIIETMLSSKNAKRLINKVIITLSLQYFGNNGLKLFSKPNHEGVMSTLEPVHCLNLDNDQILICDLS